MVGEGSVCEVDDHKVITEAGTAGLAFGAFWAGVGKILAKMRGESRSASADRIVEKLGEIAEEVKAQRQLLGEHLRIFEGHTAKVEAHIRQDDERMDRIHDDIGDLRTRFLGARR
jgi:hypothetical protein